MTLYRLSPGFTGTQRAGSSGVPWRRVTVSHASPSRMADIRVIGTVLVAPTLRLIGGWDAEDLRLGGILTVWRTFTHNLRAAAQCLLPACLVNSTRIEDAGTVHSSIRTKRWTAKHTCLPASLRDRLTPCDSQTSSKNVSTDSLNHLC